MEQADFLEQYVFAGLKNRNDGFDDASVHYFSEADFERVLYCAAYYGIGIYTIKTWFNGEFYPEASHTDRNKKATDQNWYNKALKTFSHKQPGMLYSATYKVSSKLLARENIAAVPEMDEEE
ncbi:MAG: hypothetical protein R2753_15305 [Chitinophagales bacterium]